MASARRVAAGSLRCSAVATGVVRLARRETKLGIWAEVVSFTHTSAAERHLQCKSGELCQGWPSSSCSVRRREHPLRTPLSSRGEGEISWAKTFFFFRLLCTI